MVCGCIQAQHPAIKAGERVVIRDDNALLTVEHASDDGLRAGGDRRDPAGALDEQLPDVPLSGVSRHRGIVR